MRYQTVRFEPVKRTAYKNLPCPLCQKKLRRQRTFEMTINPFNKNEDGTVRTRSDIWKVLGEKAAAWEAEPEEHDACLDKRAAEATAVSSPDTGEAATR